MRTNLIICIIIALSLIICPVAAVGNSSDEESIGQVAEEASVDLTLNSNYISVMSSSTGDVERVNLREYIIGSVAAEMNALYHSEALKAQAVASYTYAKKTREQNLKHKESYLGSADITDSPDTHQGYITKAQRQEKWGNNFKKYEEKIEAAVDEVFGKYLTYNGETALAVYHSVSSGRTQSAETMWGSKIPYLISVESQGDRLSPDYTEKRSYSEEDFKKLANECDVSLSGEADEWFKELTKADSGYILSVRLGQKEISSAKFREIFDLRSLCFNISYDDKKFSVTCYGHGHGVGMSQYGADYMARQGSSWLEILEHYYPQTEVEDD